jgi:hypothetical protein
MCVDRKVALTLLPVRNEVSFYSLLHGGRGMEMPEVLGLYRVHLASMQRNRIPGEWRDELADVYSDYLRKTDQQLKDRPHWLERPEELRAWCHEVKLHQEFSRLEAALQRGERAEAFRRMLSHWRTELSVHKRLSWLQIKMAARVALCRPYFQK